MNLGKTVLIKDNFLSYFFHVNTYLKHSENLCCLCTYYHTHIIIIIAIPSLYASRFNVFYLTKSGGL